MTTLDTRDNFPIKLNGVNYEIDLRSYRRITVDATRAQQDMTTENSEQTLNSQYLWKRTGENFSYGSGQTRFDAIETDSRFRYADSLHIDPWTPRELKLLKKVTSRIDNPTRVDPSTGATLEYELASAEFFVIDNKLILARNWIDPSYGDWRRYSIVVINDPTAASWSVTSLADNWSGSPDYIRSICSDGTNLFVRLNGTNNPIKGTYTGGGTYTTSSLGTSGTAYDRLLSVGSHLLGVRTSGSTGYLVEIKATTDTVIATYELSRMPLFTAAVAGPDGIYLSATNYRDSSYQNPIGGTTATIYRCTFNETTASYNPPSPISELPQGEVINTMVSYSGYILLGTTKGFRVGQFTQTGGITYGPLVEIGKPYGNGNYSYTQNDGKFHGGVVAF